MFSQWGARAQIIGIVHTNEQKSGTAKSGKAYDFRNFSVAIGDRVIELDVPKDRSGPVAALEKGTEVVVGAEIIARRDDSSRHVFRLLTVQALDGASVQGANPAAGETGFLGRRRAA